MSFEGQSGRFIKLFEITPFIILSILIVDMNRQPVMTLELEEELRKIKNWDFDIFKIETITPYPLVVVTECALNAVNLMSELNLVQRKFTTFILEIQQAYLNNSYHNAVHAADTTQTIFHMCTEGMQVS